MCSAVDYEMLVSHSPPLFSHSPPINLLSDYSSFHRFGSDSFAKLSRASCRMAPPNSLSFVKSKSIQLPASPKRSCLVIRPDESPVSSDEDIVSPTKLKKRVVFADDKGMSLTHVRIMSEPSNVPPFWSIRFLAEVTKGMSVEPEADKDEWEISFAQPASDYVDFRKRLDTKKVSLENVIVKENDETIMGTVKVSNISYQKEVVIRLTCDNWKTSEDAFCNYVPNAVSSAISSAYVLYDTFAFKIPIAPRSNKIEFCVCFKCEGNEYWDSNGGENYIITKKIQPLQSLYSSNEIYNKRNKNVSKIVPSNTKCKDVNQPKFDSWSEFASWTHLETSSPYW